MYSKFQNVHEFNEETGKSPKQNNFAEKIIVGNKEF